MASLLARLHGVSQVGTCRPWDDGGRHDTARFRTFGVMVAVVLVASVLFLPIVALLAHNAPILAVRVPCEPRSNGSGRT